MAESEAGDQGGQPASEEVNNTANPQPDAAAASDTSAQAATAASAAPSSSSSTAANAATSTTAVTSTKSKPETSASTVTAAVSSSSSSSPRASGGLSHKGAGSSSSVSSGSEGGQSNSSAMNVVTSESPQAIPKSQQTANRQHHTHRKNLAATGHRECSGERAEGSSHGTSRSTRGHSRNHGHHNRSRDDAHNRQRVRERERDTGGDAQPRVRTRSHNDDSTVGGGGDGEEVVVANTTSSANARVRPANGSTGPQQQPPVTQRPRSPSPVVEPLVEAVPVEEHRPSMGNNNNNHSNHGNGGGQHTVPYNWQASKTVIKERLTFIYNTETMADVHFVVGKGAQQQRIPAHKFVLSVGSAVFDAMFNGGMATTSGEVELPDVEPSAFLALLRFLYSDEVQIGPETVMTTLYTAKKYAVPALEQACVEFLKRNLSSDNAFMLLTQARLFDEPQLAALCLETIDKNTTEALGAEGFTDIDLDTLVAVLERDTLGIRECKLFKAVCRWAEAECIRQNLAATTENKRKALGPAMELIRFPLMTVEEFAMGAAQSGLLQDREVVELFLHFTVNPKPTVGFPDAPRCCLTGKEQVVSRFCQIENRWGYSGTSDRIRFMVNRRIFVVGFGLYGSIHGPSEYMVSIQIIQTDNGKVCGQNDSTFLSDGSTSTFRVMFKEPVEIQPNTSYTACATLKGPDSYYGTKGLRKVTHESVTSGKVTFQFTYAAGNNNGTSVEDGQLPEIIFYT